METILLPTFFLFLFASVPSQDLMCLHSAKFTHLIPFPLAYLIPFSSFYVIISLESVCFTQRKLFSKFSFSLQRSLIIIDKPFLLCNTCYVTGEDSAHEFRLTKIDGFSM